MRKSRATLEDLLERTAQVGGCLEWQGAISPTGYGKTKFRGVSLDAHRAIWLAAHGDIAAGLFVMHSCDNRRCVSLEHLSLGSQSDNMRDAVAKGRHRAEPPTGEDSPKAILTLEQAKQVRARLDAGESIKSVAADFPVDRSAISKLKRGVNWARALEQASS